MKRRGRGSQFSEVVETRNCESDSRSHGPKRHAEDLGLVNPGDGTVGDWRGEIERASNRSVFVSLFLGSSVENLNALEKTPEKRKMEAIPAIPADEFW